MATKTNLKTYHHYSHQNPFKKPSNRPKPFQKTTNSSSSPHPKTLHLAKNTGNIQTPNPILTTTTSPLTHNNTNNHLVLPTPTHITLMQSNTNNHLLVILTAPSIMAIKCNQRCKSPILYTYPAPLN